MTQILKRVEARDLAAIALTLAANATILLVQQRLVVFTAGFVLMCLLPGFLLSRLLAHRIGPLNWIEDLVLTSGLGCAGLILTTLGLHYVPGPLTSAHFLAAFDALVLFLLIVPSPPSTDACSPSRAIAHQPHLILLALMLIAVFFRLTHLGYSEFQGDEARAMLMAAGAIRGEDGILFLHRKGPAEILIPAAFYTLSGTTNELIARLPFAAANVAGLLTVYVLARRLFSERAYPALISLGMLAIDGYLIAFGRLVQYQSVVILMTTLSAWCAYAWLQTDTAILLPLSTLFLAVGTLAHYEAIFVAPFLVWVFFARARRAGWSVLTWLRRAVAPALVFLAVVMLFYGPFVLHPHFHLTAEYLTEERIGGESLLYNNLGDFFWRATFYNSTYYVALLILSLVALVASELSGAVEPRTVGLAASAVFVLGLATAAFCPGAWVIGGTNLALLPFVTGLALVTASSRPSTETKAVLLWFGLPSVFLLFMTRKPKNHGYLLSPAWAILAATVLTRGWEALKPRLGRIGDSRHLRHALLLASFVLVGILGYYEYIVFVRHRPNFLLSYPDSRPALYPSIHGDELPRVGFFGFPHRSGLKAAGALRASGDLQGTYRSNSEPLITSWYTRKMAWCPGSADYYVITNPIQDSEPVPLEEVRRQHGLLARVWDGGEAVSEIYSRQPVDTAIEYDLTELEAAFDASTSVDTWLWALRNPVPAQAVDANLGGAAKVLGYDAPQRVETGETFPLMLYWQADAPMTRHYNVFVHVEIPGEGIWAQSDGTPGCGSAPTTEWEPATTIVDGHSLSLDPSAPPGDYPLLVGLYDPMTGERLPVTGRHAHVSGNAVNLGTVEVAAASSAHRSEEDSL